MSVFLLADLSSRLGDCCRYVAYTTVNDINSSNSEIEPIWLIAANVVQERSYGEVD